MSTAAYNENAITLERVLQVQLFKYGDACQKEKVSNHNSGV